MQYLATEIEGLDPAVTLIFDQQPLTEDILERLSACGQPPPPEDFTFREIACRDVADWRVQSEWRLDKLKQAISSQPLEVPEGCEDDQRMRCLYLGNLINPSGKYYLPFAASNVLGDCEACGGAGQLPNLLSQPEEHARTRENLQVFIEWNRAKHGWPADWPEGEIRELRERQARLESTAPHVGCPRCGDTGSQSAYDDENWREAFEAELEELGLSLVQGLSSDGCDFFAVEYLIVDDEEDEACGYATPSLGVTDDK